MPLFRIFAENPVTLERYSTVLQGKSPKAIREKFLTKPKDWENGEEWTAGRVIKIKKMADGDYKT